MEKRKEQHCYNGGVQLQLSLQVFVFSEVASETYLPKLSHPAPPFIHRKSPWTPNNETGTGDKSSSQACREHVGGKVNGRALCVTCG